MDPAIVALIVLAFVQIVLVIFVLSRFQRDPSQRIAKQLEESLRSNRIETSGDTAHLRQGLMESISRSREAIDIQAQKTQAALAASATEASKQSELLRTSLQAAFTKTEISLLEHLRDQTKQTESGLQKVVEGEDKLKDRISKELKELRAENEHRISKMREGVSQSIQELQQGNEKKLEQMRKVVEEKLETTLQKRLGESFSLVSERLEAVHKGLGEMSLLASGVGDLKKVLTNVKTRGTWGEVQLGAILEQLLTADQYQANVCPVPQSVAQVEYAIKLPGRDKDPDSIWLPIDSKFPLEDYQRVVDFSERGTVDEVQAAQLALRRAVQNEAKKIREKYISPPHTTNFAIMFFPTEGLYAEVLRSPGLADELQRKHRVVVAGPTTLSAILNSLRMGFQTLAIEKRSSEVWQVLAGVKAEFGKFGEVLTRLGKNLQSAQNTIESAGVRTRAMEKKLRSVEELPADAPGHATKIGSLTPPQFEDESDVLSGL